MHSTISRPRNGKRPARHHAAPPGESWGYGAAPLIRAATRGSTETVVFLSDLHAPYHDEGALKSALNLIRRVNPARIVLNGDVNDFFQLSRFNTGLERLDSLQAEIDVGNAIRRAVRAAAPNAHLIETEGNHDSRIKTYVARNARALTSLTALDPKRLFDYEELEIDAFGASGFRLRPEFIVKHGSIVRKGAGTTAKAELLSTGISGISGHTHRLATHRVAGYIPRQWTEQGCLCRVDPDYVVGIPDWTQGLVVGEFSNRSGTFVMHEVPYLDGQLRLGLTRY